MTWSSDTHCLVTVKTKIHDLEEIGNKYYHNYLRDPPNRPAAMVGMSAPISGRRMPPLTYLLGLVPYLLTGLNAATALFKIFRLTLILLFL